ncbi:MAG TPA: EAL domain-containing protein [Burkholderiales bacterium]|nr:EAL domain-containing protein [Burkholderiales bacterium]
MLARPDFSQSVPPFAQAVRVLLLEDDPISVEIVGTYLRRVTFVDPELHSAGTLADALALAAQVEVDLVITDLHVPDSRGTVTVEALVRTVECPVIAITSDLDAALREATLARGAYDFVHKDQLTEATLERLVRLAAMQARTFRSLRDSEARFRSLGALTSDWFWETDAEHQFVAAPGRVSAVTGLPPEAYVGKPRWEVPGLAPLNGDWGAHRDALARREIFRDLELEQVRPDGSRCYLQISGEPIYRPDGAFIGYRGTAKDITLRRREDRLLALEHAATQRLAAAQRPSEAIRELIQAVCESEDWGCGRYFALDDAAGVMRFEQGWAAPDGRFDAFIASSLNQAYARGDGLVGRVWDTGEPLWAKDAAVHSALVFPVTSRERTVGVVSISSDAIREPDTRLLGTLRVIGSQLGHFLQRCQTEEALRASESRLRAIVSNEPQCVKLIDGDGRLLEMNPAGLRMIEADDLEALRGQCVYGLVAAEHRDAFRDLTRRVAGGQSGGLEFEIVGLKGARRWLETRAVPLRDDTSGKPLVLGITRDVTERRSAEAALRASEQRFRTLTELTSDWYWEQDAELRFVHTGGTSDARGGISPQAHVGLRRWELPRTEIVGDSWDEHRQALEARRPFTDLLLRRSSENGEIHYVSVAGRPVFDAHGCFSGYRGVAKDVTNRVAAELALRRFRAALDAAGDMVFLVDARTSAYLDFNETACRTLGYTRDEMLGMHTQEVRADRTREQLLEDYRTLAAAPNARDISVGTYRRKDGSTFPVEVTRRLLETPDGRVVVATARDLTERMHAEQRQATHLRYQERVTRFGQAALVKCEPAELVEKAVQAVLEALGAECVAYVEAESGAPAAALMLRAVVGVSDAGPRIIACARNNPLRQAMLSGTRLLADGDRLPFAWARELRSAALIPVRSDDQARAALCVCYRQASAFGAEELNFIEAMASVLSTALQRIDSEARLAYLAQFDPLTELPNRTLFADRFSQMIAQAQRHGTPLAVLFIDLDEFKVVNDTLGHAGGDALLKEVAGRLLSAVRAGDTVARISGDEFAIVLADLVRADDAALVAQKLIDRLADAAEINGKEVFVTASIGIAAYPSDGADAEALIGAADAAMYRAKQAGRNAYQFYTAEINQRSRARAQLGTELRRALERDEFALVYQPKYGLDRRQPSGAEALLRWKHPERGMVSPGEFIPVLEETGLIVPVGEWVVRRACEDLKAWLAAGVNVGPVSVNLSARQFKLQDLDKRIQSMVLAAGIDPGLIELEITESQLMQDPDHAIRVMRALREAGMRIAIDDFGTGYSSLAYLTRFPVGALKIDRSFVSDMARDKDDATIVRTIIEMAHSLGFTVVAEGVETEEQANLLRLLRCEQAQGYLYARPMPAAELSRLFSAARTRRAP